MLETIAKGKTTEGLKRSDVDVESETVSSVALSIHPGMNPQTDKTTVMRCVADYSNVSKKELLRRAWEHDVIKVRIIYQSVKGSNIETFQDSTLDMSKFDKSVPKVKIVTKSDIIASAATMSDAEKAEIKEALGL